MNLKNCQELMKDAHLFPVEVDLSRTAFQYQSVQNQNQVLLRFCKCRLSSKALKLSQTITF
jgi:hypothetical protein